MNVVWSWLDRLTARWWFGEAVVIGTCLLIVGLAIIMSPSPGTLTLFGVDVPVLCGFRRVTGMGCPGCGLTRSFVFLGHGQLVQAFQMNMLGPPLFLVVAGQIPWRVYKVGKRAAARRAEASAG